MRAHLQTHTTDYYKGGDIKWEIGRLGIDSFVTCTRTSGHADARASLSYIHSIRQFAVRGSLLQTKTVRRLVLFSFLFNLMILILENFLSSREAGAYFDD